MGAFRILDVVISFWWIRLRPLSRRKLPFPCRRFVAPSLKFYSDCWWSATALFLNADFGGNLTHCLRKRDFHALLLKHVEAGSTDVGRLEATGALNFLDLDDIVALEEGEPVDPRSIIRLPIKSGWPVLPAFERTPSDVFLRQLDASGRRGGFVDFTHWTGQRFWRAPFFFLAVARLNKNVTELLES